MSVETTNDITMYGTTWCSDCRVAKRVFSQHNIGFTWVDIEQDEAGAAKVLEINHGNQSVPTIIFSDGSTLTEPSAAVLTQKLGALGKIA